MSDVTGAGVRKVVLRAVTGMVVVLAVAAYIGVVPPTSRTPSSSSAALKINRSKYYRLKLDLTYKNAPVHIEFVGGCGIHSSFSLASGGSTVETLAMSAFNFAARMPEGHAVVVRSEPVGSGFDLCNSMTTASGEVPRKWLPLIIWYERDDDFSFGVAYVTPDAYASPRARFGFVSALVEKANGEEFEAFMRDGPKNLLPPYLADSMSHLNAPYLGDVIPPDVLREPRRAWPQTEAPPCRSVEIVTLDEKEKAWAKQRWPKDHPTYWEPSEILSKSRVKFPDGYQVMSPQTSDRKPDGIYPVLVSDSLAHVKERAASDGPRDRELLIHDPTLRGFAYCDSPASSALIDAVAGKPTSWWARYRCRVGAVVVPSSCEYMIGVMLIGTDYALFTHLYMF